MTDIVERLRDTNSGWCPNIALEAADRIAELERELAAAQAREKVLHSLSNELLHQIDINDFMDSHGHDLKMFKAVHDLMRILSQAEGDNRPLQKLGARLAELLDEDQWAECEALLLAAGVTPNAGHERPARGDGSE